VRLLLQQPLHPLRPPSLALLHLALPSLVPPHLPLLVILSFRLGFPPLCLLQLLHPLHLQPADLHPQHHRHLPAGDCLAPWLPRLLFFHGWALLFLLK
jgi:hypothetical protein